MAMKNFVQEGRMLTATAPSGGVTSGQGVIIGAMFGVAAGDAAQGKDFEMAVEGVYTLPKAAGAIGEKVKVYWITADKKVTATASGNTLIGHAAKAAADADATVEVRISN
jgi:predicted RecA/RadA family phage recombinase